MATSEVKEIDREQIMAMEAGPELDALVAECKGTIDALATSRDQAAVDVLIQTRQGRDALAAGVKAAQSFGLAVTSAIDQLNTRLGNAD